RFSKTSSSDANVSHSTFDALRLRKSGQFIVACLLLFQRQWISRTYEWVSIQSHQCGISLFSLPPLLAKVLAFSSRSCQEKSIFLESYYSDLSKTVMGRPQATRQIDHRLQCTCPEKAQTTMKSLCNRVCSFLINLRTQLYSAVKYFELSYTNDGDTQSVVETQKHYAIKTLLTIWALLHTNSMNLSMKSVNSNKTLTVFFSYINPRLKRFYGEISNQNKHHHLLARLGILPATPRKLMKLISQSWLRKTRVASASLSDWHKSSKPSTPLSFPAFSLI
ncbi:hypothetical protein HID58_071910, partial [Brassica napus]